MIDLVELTSISFDVLQVESCVADFHGVVPLLHVVQE